jgi:hypothetical protein
MHINGNPAHRGAPSGGILDGGAGCGPRGRQACRTRAARGSTRRSLRTSCQELADRRGMRRKAWPGTRTEPQLERREARLPDRNGRPHASQACWGGFADCPGSLASSRVSRRSAPLFGSVDECEAQPARHFKAGGKAMPLADCGCARRPLHTRRIAPVVRRAATPI